MSRCVECGLEMPWVDAERSLLCLGVGGCNSRLKNPRWAYVRNLATYRGRETKGRKQIPSAVLAGAAEGTGLGLDDRDPKDEDDG